MELTINIKMDEHFTNAVEMLAVALAKCAKAYADSYVPDDAPQPEVEVMTKEEEVKVDKAPLIEKLKEELDLVEVEKPTITRAELQAKAARLMQVEKGKYALDLKGALAQCGAANISSLDEGMFEKFNSLMADLWEVAA